MRGLHYQVNPHPQAKLVRCVVGEIFDVAVDLRVGSPTFGQWVGAILNSTNCYQLWIPVGFAHGFLALSQDAVVLYKVDQFRYQNHEHILNWNDQSIGIKWPLINESYNLSDKDKKAPNLSEINKDDLF